ncbi:60s acidic ribosomal protein-domain-containing protein [Circinella umbellata]|nr:60s acidic ribosomal protein-domain-containing protein [Circinella umbellata]
MSSDLAIVYAALILKDDNVEVTADKLQTLTKEAGLTEIEPIWFSLYAKALEGQDLKELIFNIGAGGAAAGAATGGAAAGGAAEEAAAEEAKEEEKEESDDDMGFGLFD